MRRKIAFVLIVCLFVVAAKIFRLQLRQQKVECEAANTMKRSVEMMLLMEHY